MSRINLVVHHALLILSHKLVQEKDMERMAVILQAPDISSPNIESDSATHVGIVSPVSVIYYNCSCYSSCPKRPDCRVAV
jgi:hypothetical protein